MQAIIQDWLFSLKHYVKMCLFSSSPASLPSSQANVALTFIAYWLSGILLLSGHRSILSISAQVVIEIGLLFSVTIIMLKFKKMEARLMQTLSALIGVNLIISIITIPILLLLPEPGEELSISSLSVQLNLLLLLWNLAVISLIFQRAFEIRTIVAGFITFNYFLFYELLIINLFQ